jgi:hypothetical protein
MLEQGMNEKLILPFHADKTNAEILQWKIYQDIE